MGEVSGLTVIYYFLNKAHFGFGGVTILSSVHGDPFQSAQGAIWCWGWRSVFLQVKPAFSEQTPWPRS